MQSGLIISSACRPISTAATNKLERTRRQGGRDSLAAGASAIIGPVARSLELSKSNFRPRALSSCGSRLSERAPSSSWNFSMEARMLSLFDCPSAAEFGRAQAISHKLGTSKQTKVSSRRLDLACTNSSASSRARPAKNLTRCPSTLLLASLSTRAAGEQNSNERKQLQVLMGAQRLAGHWSAPLRTGSLDKSRDKIRQSCAHSPGQLARF